MFLLHIVSDITIIIFCLLLAYQRLTGYKSKAYQAISHLFVGTLWGLNIAVAGHRWFYFMAWFSISLVELFQFLKDKPDVPSTRGLGPG